MTQNASKKSAALSIWIRRGFFAAVMAGISFVGLSAIFAFQLTGPARRPIKPVYLNYQYTPVAIAFQARDGVALRGWFLPCPGARKAVILLHGNGSTRAQMLARAELLRAHGYAALAYDARGHGESAGERVSAGWHEVNDLLGAADYLTGQGYQEFGCIGVSQGGATIALAAGQLPRIRWAVLESVYPTLRETLDHRFHGYLKLPGSICGAVLYPVAELRLGISLAHIAPEKTIGQLSCPLLIMSGDTDPYVTAAETERLFAAAREPKQLWLVHGAAHVDLYGFAKEQYAQTLLGFLQSLETEYKPSAKL